jgi:hypothetical protein
MVGAERCLGDRQCALEERQRLQPRWFAHCYGIAGQDRAGLGRSYRPAARRVARHERSKLGLPEILSHRGYVWFAAFSPNGLRIVTGSEHKTARVWDAATGKELVVLGGHEGFVMSAALSPDGLSIVTGLWDRTARVWDAATGKELVVLRGHEGP